MLTLVCSSPVRILSVLLLLLAPSTRPAIPQNLLAYLKDYDAPGTTLRAGFVPYKAELVYGEPLELTFTVQNLGPEHFQFTFGGDYRGVGRHDRYKISIADAAGNALPDPH